MKRAVLSLKTKQIAIGFLCVVTSATIRAQGPLPALKVFTHADTLRGSNGPARAWWDAEFYDLHVTVNPADSSIRGWNAITYRVLEARSAQRRAQSSQRTEMQIDLQVPMQIDSIVQNRSRLTFRRDSNAFFVRQPTQPTAARRT